MVYDAYQAVDAYLEKGAPEQVDTVHTGVVSRPLVGNGGSGLALPGLVGKLVSIATEEGIFDTDRSYAEHCIDKAK